MSPLGKFELEFLKSVENSLSKVPSDLDPISEDLWRSTLLSLSNQLRDIAVLIYCHHESV